jgi:hypothetical protein
MFLAAGAGVIQICSSIQNQVCNKNNNNKNNNNHTFFGKTII